jgi:hypothetical protein
VRHWDRYQHYEGRRPVWIKLHTELLHNDAYLALSGHCRAVLVGLWLEYASSHCQLRLDTRSLTRRLNLRVTSQHVKSLNDAGFIDIVASKPLAPRYLAREEKRREEQNHASLPVASYEGNSKKNGMQAFDNRPKTEDDPQSWPPS